MFVEQALDALEEQQIAQASLHATPISILGQYFAATKGQEVEPERFNPFGAYLYRQEAKETIDPAAAATFLELSAAQLVPAWVVAQLDIKQLRAAAR